MPDSDHILEQLAGLEGLDLVLVIVLVLALLAGVWQLVLWRRTDWEDEMSFVYGMGAFTTFMAAISVGIAVWVRVIL